MTRTAPLPPNSTIGIFGGGQLGRMTALAAARLGYRCHVFTPERDSPAEQVCAGATIAPYDDRQALDRFAAEVQVVTSEFENVSADALRHLAKRVPVRPGPEVLAIAQDRIKEKTFCNSVGAPTTLFHAVRGPQDVARALADLGAPAVLKTARMGYDGKGQVKLDRDARPDEAWRAMKADEGIVEAWVAFEREISVIVARGVDGAMLAYPAVENRHRHHILDETIAPAPIPAQVAAEADRLARLLAEKLDVVGLLAVEMFVAREGAVLVNEIAPRPHNSGHWTIDACLTSQFEQCVRAVAGLPLGSVAHVPAVMKNLIGDEAETWLELLKDPTAKLHLYGKAEARPGRKMGHVTWVNKAP
ncbi:MAG: 5-(carboxyamino)imidazole ribonucleotide synthase [Alphaproteobacteria bacterium]|nr:5-(carboxyamino)imidazole ribonucleotide synthase [Alphaproteobacteria bacterium]